MDIDTQVCVHASGDVRNVDAQTGDAQTGDAQTGDAKREYSWGFIPSPYESGLPTLHTHILRDRGSMLRYRKPVTIRDRNATRVTYDFSDELLLVTYRSGGNVGIKWNTTRREYASDISDSSKITTRSRETCEIFINPIATGKANKVIIESASRWTIVIAFDVLKDPASARISEQWTITPYLEKMRFQEHIHSDACAKNCTFGVWILDGHPSSMSAVKES
jgi:hypothetical protein